MNIIIADDSELLRNSIKESLSDLQNIKIVGEADNGIETVKIIEEKKPDLVILDIRMPEMNGIEVLRKIKEGGTKLKVCIFTNYPYSQYKEKCLDEGADYFFDKNINFQEIKNLIVQLAKEVEK